MSDAATYSAALYRRRMQHVEIRITGTSFIDLRTVPVAKLR